MYSPKDSIETKVIWSTKNMRIVAQKSYNQVSLFFEKSFKDALGNVSWQPAIESDVFAFLLLDLTERALEDYGIKKLFNGRTKYKFYPIDNQET